MRFSGRCFRAHDPAWSFTPLSGAGAAMRGGRFNRKGVATLYLSLDIVTAVGECTQGFTHRLQPLTLCEYDVDCADIADLHSPTGRAALDVSLEDLACSWLAVQLASRTPPSWRVVDRLMGSGHAGALMPSFVPGAVDGSANLVLWRWGSELPHRVAVYDPQRRLPSDQSSWPRLEP